MKWMIWPCVLLMALILAFGAEADTILASPDGLSLTDALAMAADGDTILLADGAYTAERETFPIVVDRSVSIAAAEGAHPVIWGAALKSTLIIEADGVSLQDLDIMMLRHGLYVTGNALTVERCSITLADESWRTSSCGVWLAGVKHCVFRGCSFTGCAIALVGPPLNEHTPDVPKLTGMFEVGEDVEFFTTHTIEDCTVNGKPLFYCVNAENVTAPADAGCILIANCKGVTVDGADVSYGSMGCEIAYCSDVTVRHTTASYCGIFGIYLAKDPDGMIDCCYTEGTNHGIDIRDCTGVVTRDCTAYACDQGIFYSLVRQGLISGCTVDSTDQGIFIAVGYGCEISGCRLTNCENGMDAEKENDLLVTGCTFAGNTICAARLDRSDTLFIGNTLDDNWVDLMAYGGVSVNIIGNTVTNSRNTSLYLRDIAYSRISGNTFGGKITAKGSMSGTLFCNNVLAVAPAYEGDSVMHEVDNVLIP